MVLTVKVVSITVSIPQAGPVFQIPSLDQRISTDASGWPLFHDLSIRRGIGLLSRDKRNRERCW